MRLRALHRTTYRYPFASRESHNEVRLRPLDDDHQRCLAFELGVEPAAKLFSYREEGGTVHHFVVRTPHTAIPARAANRSTVGTCARTAAVQPAPRRAGSGAGRSGLGRGWSRGWVDIHALASAATPPHGNSRTPVTGSKFCALFDAGSKRVEDVGFDRTLRNG